MGSSHVRADTGLGAKNMAKMAKSWRRLHVWLAWPVFDYVRAFFLSRPVLREARAGQLFTKRTACAEKKFVHCTKEWPLID